MVGSTKIGARRLESIFEDHGTEETLAYFEALLEYAERMMRNEIARIPDGVYEGVEEMNNDVFSRTKVKIRVTITVRDTDLTVDFAGTDPQIESFKNSSFANTHAAVYMAMATLVDAQIPHNDGTFRPIRIIAPRGTLVNPEPPAPQTYSTVFPSHQIIHACWKALAQSVPERVSAGWGAPSYPTMGGYQDGEGYVMYHWGGSSGTGAVKGRDGFDQLGLLVSLGGLTLPNLELYEQLYPVHFRHLEFRVDAAGAGEFRGGTGVSYEVSVSQPAKWGFRGEGLFTPTGFGLNGGRPGKPGTATLDPRGSEERPAPQYAIQELPPCTFRMESPAGGGWGDPLQRDPKAVHRDVVSGILSIGDAREVYGVVIEPETGELDHEATAARRERMEKRVQGVVRSPS
jgi:N-methylhydantoinase B